MFIFFGRLFFNEMFFIILMQSEGLFYKFILCLFLIVIKDLDLFGVLCNEKNWFVKKLLFRLGINICNGFKYVRSVEKGKKMYEMVLMFFNFVFFKFINR